MYFIDHYDSFSYNVIDWLTGDDSDIEVIHLQYDSDNVTNQIFDRPLPLVISPGPKRPSDVGTTLELVRPLLGKVPILGICLGHQILGSIGGFYVTNASHPFHGSTIEIVVENPGLLFAGMPKRFDAATYNSLILKQNLQRSDPSDWVVNAVDQYGEIQAVTWTKCDAQPAFGVQFHPESFLTVEKIRLRENWLEVVSQFMNTRTLKQNRV